VSHRTQTGSRSLSECYVKPCPHVVTIVASVDRALKYSFIISMDDISHVQSEMSHARKRLIDLSIFRK